MIHWKSWAEFADMGGYALYVWGSYAVAALALGSELMLLRRRRRQARAEVVQWQALNGDAHDPAP